MRVIVLISLLLMLPSLATADHETFQLMGFTKTKHMGDVGVLGATRACQQTFVRSRMCTSVEVMETIDVPKGLAGEAWVRPVLGSMGGNSIKAFDASGAAFNVNDLTCLGQTSANPRNHGLVVTAAGGFAAGKCGDEFPIACCAAPSPPPMAAAAVASGNGLAFAFFSLLVVSVAAASRRGMQAPLV